MKEGGGDSLKKRLRGGVAFEPKKGPLKEEGKRT